MSKEPSPPSYTPDMVARILRGHPASVILRGKLSILLDMYEPNKPMPQAVAADLRAALDGIESAEGDPQ